MKLYLLKRIGHVRYDENAGFVIRAETEQRARTLASMESADEGAECWLNPEKSTCSEIEVEGSEEIIITDFNAG